MINFACMILSSYFAFQSYTHNDKVGFNLNMFAAVFNLGVVAALHGKLLT